MTLITHSSILKRADELAVGDIIPGGDAVKGHEVLVARHGRLDAMLGMVTIVTVRPVSQDPEYQDTYPQYDYVFRPYDKLWIDA